MDAANTKAQARLSRLHDACSAVCARQRAAWTACAVASLLSSRYILVESNVHFPLHLLLIHFALAGVVAVTSQLSRQPDIQPLRPTTLGWVFLVTTATTAAASMILSVQAVLHFQNLPTLVMLAAISCCAEAWILIGRSPKPRSRLDITRIAVATLSCAGILLAEYRLLVSALLTAIPAVLFGGFARALRSVAVSHMYGAVFDTRRMNTLFCCAGLAITGFYTVYREDESWDQFFYALKMKDMPLLVVNYLATSAAMLIGQSILLPIDSGSTDANDLGHDSGFRDILTLLSTVGCIGLSSTLMLRRSYTSWPQFAFFYLALGCLFNTATIEQTWNGWKRYRLVTDASNLHARDSEDTVLSEMLDITRTANRCHYRRSILKRALLSLFLVTLWIPYWVLNVSTEVYRDRIEFMPTLDLQYISTRAAVDIVISMYKEPVEEVAHLISTLRAMPNLRDSYVHIYIKDGEANKERIKLGTGANGITMLANIGREGETYLYHILHNWDSLANHTVFLQADVHNPREFYPRIRDYFDPVRTGMLSLGWSGHVCNCNHCGDRMNFWDTTQLFPQTYARINNTAQCNKVLLSYKGQFVVSARRIRGIDKAIYHGLHQAFMDQNSWAHQEEFLQGRADSMSAPVFGYTMERMWNLLFQCSNMRVAWKCPTLLSGNRVGGGIEDCQCFDPLSYIGFRERLDSKVKSSVSVIA